MNEFIGYIYFATSKAFLFQDHYWDAPTWVPFSQSEIIEDFETMERRVRMTHWICKQKGIFEFTYYNEEELLEG